MNIKKDLISKITEVLAELSPRQDETSKRALPAEQMEFLFEQSALSSDVGSSPRVSNIQSLR